MKKVCGICKYWFLIGDKKGYCKYCRVYKEQDKTCNKFEIDPGLLEE